MLSIKNENILRDSGPTNLQTWRAEVPRGSALDQIMEDVLNHAAKQAVAEGKGDELEDELEEAQSEARTMKARAAARATEAQAAEKAFLHEKAAHEACRDVAADLRAQLAAAMSLIPHYVAIGDLRNAHRSFAADLAELERLRGFEADRLEQDARQADDKAAAPVWEPQPCSPEAPSAEIPEEMFEGGYTKTWSAIDENGQARPIPKPGGPGTFILRLTDAGAERIELATLTPEQIEELKQQPTEPIRFIPSPSRKRLDALALRAHEVADGQCKATDLRRLADIVASLANAVEPKS